MNVLQQQDSVFRCAWLRRCFFKGRERSIQFSQHELRIFREIFQEISACTRKLIHVLIAIFRILFQACFEDWPDSRRFIGKHFECRDLCAQQDIVESFVAIPVVERVVVREQLIKECAGAENIRSRIAVLLLHLLRRQVNGRAPADCRMRQMFSQHVSDGKVPDLRRSIESQVDFRRCQVAVQDAVFVGMTQPLGDLDHDGNLCFHRHGRLLRDQALKTGAAQRFHDNKMGLPVFARIENGGDAGWFRAATARHC